MAQPTINIYRSGEVNLTVTVDDNSVHRNALMGEDVLRLHIQSRTALDLDIGDYITHGGVNYYLNARPNVIKTSGLSYEYGAEFESVTYNLSKAQFLSADGDGDFSLMENLDGFIDLIVTNMERVYGAASWDRGTCDQTDDSYRLMHFKQENCLQVLQRLAQEFSGEFHFTGTDIGYTDQIGSDTGESLSYGQGNGLYTITRRTVDSANIVTRLYAFGSERNLDSSYGANRLKPPVVKNLLTNPGFETGDFTGWSQWGTPDTRTLQGTYTHDGSYAVEHVGTTANEGSSQTIDCEPETEYTVSCWCKRTSGDPRIVTLVEPDTYSSDTATGTDWERLSATVTTAAGQTELTVWIGGNGVGYFDSVQIERGANVTDYYAGSVYYLEKNVSSYGLIEHTGIWDEVYPTRTGTVTGVHATNELIFYDTGMDFDLNSYLIDGVTAKIHWQTGDLAGYQFEIASDGYDHGTNEFTLIATNDKKEVTLPHDTLKPAVGDEYKIIDITLPQSYIDTASETLLTLAQTYLDENADPRVTYEIEVDPRYAETNTFAPDVGDKVTVVDSDLGVSSLVRIVSVERSLANQYRYRLLLSDQPAKSLIERLYDDAKDLKNRAAVDAAGDIVRARANWRTAQELWNSVFDPDGYFTDKIRPLSIETTALSVGAKSQYFALRGVRFQPNYGDDANAMEVTGGYLDHFVIPDGGATWTLQANSFSSLTPATAYYIYARCDKDDYASANNTVVLDDDQLGVNDDADYYYFLIGLLHPSDGTTRRISLSYGNTDINGNHVTTGVINASLVNITGLTSGDVGGLGDLATEDAADWLTQVDGANKPDNNATVGATWGTNIASIPARFANEDDSPDATGVYITPNFIGFYDQPTATWSVRIKNNSGTGEFYVGNGSDKYVAWDGSALTVSGNTQTSPSGKRVVLDNSDNSLKFFNSSGNKSLELISAADGTSGLSFSYGGTVDLYRDASNDIQLVNLPTYGTQSAQAQVNVFSEHGTLIVPSIMTAWDTSAGGNGTAFAVISSAVGGAGFSGNKVLTAGYGDTWSRYFVDSDEGFKVGGTTVINSSRNIVNIGTVDGVDLNGGTTDEFLRGDGTWQTPPGSITDHDELAGLGDDDHAQYLTSTRHAAIGGNPHGLDYSDVGAAASSHSHSFASITSKPTTLSGYGITDAASDTELNAHKNDNGIGAHLPASQGSSGQYVNYMGQFSTITWSQISKGTVHSGSHSWVDPSTGDTHSVTVSSGLITGWTES